MKIIKKSNIINKIINKTANVGFVPTMGTLHEGHISLIKKSKQECLKTVVSIFVNPKQFNKRKDFLSYPKKIKNDLKICKKYKVDYVFVPSFFEIYSWKTRKITYPKIANMMEHKFRKNHFKGVMDVMSKLLSIINNTKVYMGKKDYQQLHIIKEFCKINKIPSKIVACKTIRSREGFALSSRNLLLDKPSLLIMSKVFEAINHYKKKNINKKINVHLLKTIIKKMGVDKIDYIDLIKLDKFIPAKTISLKTNIFIAYYLKNVRLIDNI